MLPTRRGSFRLFHFAGIDVFLHYSWLLVAVYGIQQRQGHYTTMIWPVLEYLALFVIVLMHEFGHALACRQVGGQASEIVLWPLGGVAYVSPPQRPGATLWSIAAGPLVNVVLFPILSVAWYVSNSAGWEASMPNAYHFIEAVWWIDLGLLIFNILPVYPLDGGQILRSLLWFFLGRARSLMVAASIGFVGVAALAVVAFMLRDLWAGVIVAFIGYNCWQGFQQARMLTKLAQLPRRKAFACPSCKQAPIIGPLWVCHKCQTRFDTFETLATCPGCGEHFPATTCPECGQARPLMQWESPARPF